MRQQPPRRDISHTRVHSAFTLLQEVRTIKIVPEQFQAPSLMKPLERSEGELSSLLHDLYVGVTFLSSAYFLAKTNHSLRLDSTLIHNRYKAHRFRNNNWLHENVHYCAGTMTIMIGRSLFHCLGLVDLLTAQFGARIVPWEHNQQTVLREYFLGGGVGIFQMPLPVMCSFEHGMKASGCYIN